MLRKLSYHDFLEVLKIEFGDYLRMAESAKTIRFVALKARQQSIKLRFILKLFREKSIENDRMITDFLSESKQKLKEFVRENNTERNLK